MNIQIRPERDEKLTNFGKTTLKDRYLQPDEDFQELFVRVATAYADDEDHAQRLYDYMSQLWFMPSTPILSNGGTKRGLPISCFLNEVADTMESITDTQTENFWLAAKGGGIGTHWSNVRSKGEAIGKVGESSGIIPFIAVQDRQTLAVSQGSLRRGSSAAWLGVNHPEIEEFLGIRKPAGGGDTNRKCLNIHHGVVIDDKFMEAVNEGSSYDLISPATGEVMKKIEAKNLWHKMLKMRGETGEPYMLFIDTVNDAIPAHHKELDLWVKMSNLCAEITLATNEERTAVCCLASLNAATYEEWKDIMPQMVEDVLRFLDNVLQEFIDNAPDTHAKAKFSAMMERSVGLGTMGFHTYLLNNEIVWGSPESYEFNEKFYSEFDSAVYEANVKLGVEKGACPDWLEADIGGDPLRFSNASAIAPTASISIICGQSSAGCDPIPTNVYNHKTLSGTVTVRNPTLEGVLRDIGKDTDEVWTRILNDEGSVKNLEFLSADQRALFRTAYEIDQMDSVKLNAQRKNYIDQSQSLNIFVSPYASKFYMNKLHLEGHRLGVKSFYYCRSKSLTRGESVGTKEERVIIEECESCQ